MSEINDIQLLLDDHVETEEFGKIYFPTVPYLKKYGERGFNKLISPFALTLDVLDIPDEYKLEIKVFDLFFQRLMFSEDESYYDVLMNSLKYYFRLEPKYHEQYYCIEIGSKIIHRNNFDNLADIILKVSKAQRFVAEKPPKFENDIQKDIYNKIQEGRRKKNEKNRISFATMINVVMNGGNHYISAEEINKMTIFQLISRYDFIMETDTWDMNFDKYLVGCDPKDLDLTYWIYKVKI